MFLVDTQMAIPITLIALTVIAIFGSNLSVLIPVIGLSSWCRFARLARGEVRAVLGMEYVQGARALGVSEWRIAWKYILPNIVSPLVVLATYNFSQIMLLESSLSFLGLGVQPPGASLGSLVGAGRDYLMTAWWIALAPGLMLVLITMIMSLLGDYVRDVYDPRLRH
jgi:peptide/nickel transport system permease protein